MRVCVFLLLVVEVKPAAEGAKERSEGVDEESKEPSSPKSREAEAPEAEPTAKEQRPEMAGEAKVCLWYCGWDLLFVLA